MITRSGRVSKPPERYTPIEKVEDDYPEEDYDSDDSGGTEVEEEESEEEGSDTDSFIDDEED